MPRCLIGKAGAQAHPAILSRQGWESHLSISPLEVILQAVLGEPTHCLGLNLPHPKRSEFSLIP